MFRNMGSEGHFSGGQTPASPHGRGVASSALENQESSWISLFSVVSRPALSFLQKYLPGRPRTPALSDNVADWVSGDLKHNVDEESTFSEQLDDILPLTQHAAPHLAYLRCQHHGAAGHMEARAGSTLHWLTADSLREIGIQSDAELDVNISQQTQMGYFSTARSFVSHVLLSSASAQEIKHAEGGKGWPTEAAGSPVKSSSGTWWGGFWGSEGNSRNWPVSNLSWGKEGTITGQHCVQQPATGTKAAVAKTTELFVQSSSRESMPGENTGQSHHKEEPVDNGDLQLASLESLQRSEGSTLNHRPSISSHLISAGATTACSEVALLTPDQDNGYSSLEEEHSHICQLYMVKGLCEEEPLKGGSTAIKREPVREISEEGESTTATGMELGEREEETEDSDIRGLEDEEDEERPTQESSSAAATVLTTPHCQNKAIAYIMGSPCSDDDSQSDSESSEDDDGFDSEGSSELSDSVYEDEEGSDSDNEADSETEHLWNSLCQSRDPYNPRNFTARLPTNTTAPRTIPTTTTSASPCSTPTSSPNQVPSPLSSSPASPPFTSSSPPQNHDVWDDSTSASEVDEVENHRLWKSFSASSDPYSPLNFQAPLRTQRPTEAGPRAKGRDKKGSQTPPRSPYHTASSPPQYRKEEAEERLDSGFSEPVASSTTSLGCVTLKKVRFCEEVEEFFASCGEEEEDRRGPWEELARDRCRFLRRCQEVEQSIAYCLQPQHRGLVYQKMTVWYRHGC